MGVKQEVTGKASTLPSFIFAGIAQIFEVGQDKELLADSRKSNVEAIHGEKRRWAFDQAQNNSISFLPLALVNRKNIRLNAQAFSIVEPLDLELKFSLLVFVLDKCKVESREKK